MINVAFVFAFLHGCFGANLRVGKFSGQVSLANDFGRQLSTSHWGRAEPKVLPTIGSKILVSKDEALRKALGVCEEIPPGSKVEIAEVDKSMGKVKVKILQTEKAFGFKEEAFFFAQTDKVPDLSGRTPSRSRIVGTVWYGSTGGAWSGYSRSDDYSVRWTGSFTVHNAGSYSFWVESDDGSILYIDGGVVVNNDGLHGMVAKQANKDISAGFHSLKLEYFERGGHAGMLFKLKGPDTANAWSYGQSYIYHGEAEVARTVKAKNHSESGFREEAFFFSMGDRIPSLAERSPDMVKRVKKVWYESTGNSWPGYKRSDDFAVRWTGFLRVEKAGSYTFWISSDDGSKVYLDNMVVVNNDGLHGMREKTGSKFLEAGEHFIKLECFERGGGAGMLFKFKGLDTEGAWSTGGDHIHQGKLVASSFKEEAFYVDTGSKMPELEGRKPDMITDTSQVWYESTGNAWPGYSRGDKFAVRWTGLLSIKHSGSYIFRIDSDDGSKLFIDGTLQLDNDGLHSMKGMEKLVGLDAGYHKLLLEYYEHNGNAGMLFKYKGPDTNNAWSKFRNHIYQIFDGNSWIPINALEGYKDYGTKKVVPPGVLEEGIEITIIKDKEVYEKKCEEKSIMAIIEAGGKGIVKSIDKADGTAMVATKGCDEAWVPIQAFEGFANWPKPSPPPKKKEAPEEKKKTEKKKKKLEIEAATELEKDAEAGDTVVHVVSTDGFKKGGEIVIGEGETEESNVVVEFGSMMLKKSLKYPHKVGERVVMTKRSLNPRAGSVPAHFRATEFVKSGCRRIAPESEDHIKAHSTSSASGMSPSRCFTKCKAETGMKYFGLRNGNVCFCAPVMPGADIRKSQCDRKCSGDDQEMCGGVAGATSVYTMIDCEAASDKEVEADVEEDQNKLLTSYSMFDTSCASSDDNLCEVNGSARLAGSIDECKVACWEGKGSETCHGFTYDDVKEECTFHQDVVASGMHKSGQSCYFKKANGRPSSRKHLRHFLR